MEAMKDRLRNLASTLDPLRLRDEIRSAQAHLAALATGQLLPGPSPRDQDLEKFMKSLATAWHHTEIRPTHQSAPKPLRHWRTRKDPFVDSWPRILGWLDVEPDGNGRDILDRLQADDPGTYPDGQLRTLQRKLKEWRGAAARRLVFAAPLES